MASAPHLIFSLHNSLYAVQALAVCEIIQLPELTPLAQSPAFMIGVFNLRGKVVPVIDLNARLGYASQRFQTSDSVILLESDGALVGIIVQEVRRVQSLEETQIEALPDSPLFGRSEESAARFLAGIGKIEDEIVMLLNVENLLRLPEYSEQNEYSGNGELQDSPISSPLPEYSFCPEATPQEKAIFRQRAQSLRQVSDAENSSGLLPLAVVGLSGEYFGIELNIVREFSDLRAITPVPCCPPHVVGQMNLRGAILTLMDIRAALQMPLASTHRVEDNRKVVVIENDDWRFGVLVDEVFDVIHLSPENVREVPAAVQSQSEEFLKGTANFEAKMLGILDLPKILHQGVLTVHEEA